MKPFNKVNWWSSFKKIRVEKCFSLLYIHWTKKCHFVIGYLEKENSVGYEIC